ncbi:MAG: hypothetical protein QOJ61_1398, partial [Mycobacterium sp.]|nr:hypothetical protein [Mycobacterium sp.]
AGHRTVENVLLLIGHGHLYFSLSQRLTM